MIRESSILQAARSAAAALVLAATASCGGGGGGGSSPAPPAPPPTPAVPTALLALNSSNAQDVAAGATLTGLGASTLSSLVQGALQTRPAQRRTHLLTRFVRQQIDRLTGGLEALPAAPVAGVATTTPCMVSGSVTLDQGTGSATETFNACSDLAGVSVDGTITIANMTVDPGVSFSGVAGLNLAFKQNGSLDVGVMGSNVNVTETVNVGVNTVTLTGPEMFTMTGTVAERLGNFTLVATLDASTETDEITLNYANTKIGGSVNLSTSTPCVTDLTKQFPHTGVLVLTGAAASVIRVTINGDETLATPQVTIDLDADGNGTFETTITKNWADLSV